MDEQQAWMPPGMRGACRIVGARRVLASRPAPIEEMDLIARLDDDDEPLWLCQGVGRRNVHRP